MRSINSLFQQAQLAEAAYANLSGKVIWGRSPISFQG